MLALRYLTTKAPRKGFFSTLKETSAVNFPNFEKRKKKKEKDILELHHVVFHLV